MFISKRHPWTWLTGLTEISPISTFSGVTIGIQCVPWNTDPQATGRPGLGVEEKNFISLRVRKCGFTHASRAEICIFTPRDIKFRTILVRKNVFLTSVITSLAFGSCCKLTLVRKRFIALVS